MRQVLTFLCSNRSPISDSNIDLVLRELDLPRIPHQECAHLICPPTPTEIKESFFSLADNKSPGLDGYNAEFFEFYWPIVGPGIITEAVQRFFATGFILKEWNATLLVLIPKIVPPQEVNHLRPISLCNVLYKCIAKCMVNRMQHLLPSLIEDYQNAFIPGRHMEDNILLTHELTHIINKQRRTRKHLATLKLDMNKAYDRVNWNFLLRVLNAYGFPSHWVRLIRECISTVTYKVLINGVATPSFTPTCGLRQGDPLSPYLFLFCIDILSRMTTLDTDIRKFQGIRIHARGPFISHLFFADDAMFFFKVSAPACEHLSTVINRFCAISGQLLNLRKSFVKFSPNIPAATQQHYRELLSMDSASSLGTYLGIDIQGSKVQHFTPMLDKNYWENCAMGAHGFVSIG